MAFENVKGILSVGSWTPELIDIANDTCGFRGCSPAALPLLASMNAAER
jgi:hypothetical protein